MSKESNVVNSKPNVVIVGAGFGGLYAAQSLGYAPVNVTIIDKNNYHLFQPMLYQVATSQLSGDEIASPIRTVLRKQRNAEVIMAEVTSVDMVQRKVLMGEDSLEYDYLILATGSHYNYFGHDWHKFAPSLKTIPDAQAIRGAIVEAFEKAEKIAIDISHNSAEVEKALTFVLVGAGPTGVELSGAIAELAASLIRDYKHVSASQIHVVLLDAVPDILTSFPKHLAQKASRKLKSLNIQIRTGEKVVDVDSNGVTVEDKSGHKEKIRSNVVIWTAGVIGSSAAQWLDAPHDKDNRICVNANFSVPGHPNIFAIGDTATITNRPRNLLGFTEAKAHPLPGVAQPAIQAGRYVAKVIRRKVRGLSAPSPFQYWDKGDLATVGKGFAIADLKILNLSGVVAWLLWLGVHIFYLIGFANRILVMVQWTFTILMSQRGARDFSTSEKPKEINKILTQKA